MGIFGWFEYGARLKFQHEHASSTPATTTKKKASKLSSAPETKRQDLLELPKVGRADARDGVPPFRGVEPGRAAAGVVARGDVVERVGREGVDRVHERVQEPERGQARGEARRVEQRDEARECWRRGGGAPDEPRAPAEEDEEVVCLGGDVGDGLVSRNGVSVVSGARGEVFGGTRRGAIGDEGELTRPLGLKRPLYVPGASLFKNLVTAVFWYAGRGNCSSTSHVYQQLSQTGRRER